MICSGRGLRRDIKRENEDRKTGIGAERCVKFERASTIEKINFIKICKKAFDS